MNWNFIVYSKLQKENPTLDDFFQVGLVKYGVLLVIHQPSTERNNPQSRHLFIRNDNECDSFVHHHWQSGGLFTLTLSLRLVDTFQFSTLCAQILFLANSRWRWSRSVAENFGYSEELQRNSESRAYVLGNVSCGDEKE